MRKVTVAIFGASGYVGSELLRLCLQHPAIDVVAACSRQYDGKRVADVFPNFVGKTDLCFTAPAVSKIAPKIQAAFLCLPHREGFETIRALRKAGVKIVDLSADFRFRNTRTYEKTYGKHEAPELTKQARYGLCEIFGKELHGENLVAAPGCYVTSVLLALAPLVQNQLLADETIICDVKSGISGAGRKAETDLLFAERFGDFKAYGLSGHRHRPEIEEKLSLLAGRSVKTLFIPHLLPVARGILSTVYVQPIRQWKNPEKLTEIFRSFYRSSSFITVLDAGRSPQLSGVVGTNDCHLSVQFDTHAQKIIVISALDNLLKGAAGQAVQIFNLVWEFDERLGLMHIAPRP